MTFFAPAMPLPADSVPRIRKHTRSVRFDEDVRADRLWDIEAHFTDLKPDDFPLAPGVRPAGLPDHPISIQPGTVK